MLSSVVCFIKINVIGASRNWAREEVKHFWCLGSVLLIEEAVRAGLSYSSKAHSTDLQGRGQGLMNAYCVTGSALAQNETWLFHFILRTASPYRRGPERWSDLPRVTQLVMGGVRALDCCSPGLLSGATGELLRTAFSPAKWEKLDCPTGPWTNVPLPPSDSPQNEDGAKRRWESARILSRVHVCAGKGSSWSWGLKGLLLQANPKRS